MRIRLLVAVAATAAAVAGCGTTAQHDAHSAHEQMAGMSGMEMAGMHMQGAPSHGRPSAAAAMICTGETGRAVERTFQLDAVPQRQQMWMPPVYGCTWTLPHSTLDLAVDDATDPAKGRKRFEQLRATLPGAQKLGGLAAFGFPALQSPAGMVVFLKDDKVLSVDAREVAAKDLPQGFSREDVAYGVASAVIACWSE
jgi:hypothetical protein